METVDYVLIRPKSA